MEDNHSVISHERIVTPITGIYSNYIPKMEGGCARYLPFSNLTSQKWNINIQYPFVGRYISTLSPFTGTYILYLPKSEVMISVSSKIGTYGGG